MSTLPPENPERRPEGGSEPELPADLVVPDDLSTLHHEVLALRRERAAERRAQRWGWLRRLPSSRLSAPLVLAAMALVVTFGILLSVYAPRDTAPLPPANPLASTTVAAGQVGGLLPADTLEIDGRPVASSALRPAVLALMPVGCGCEKAAGALVTQADTIEEGTQVVFVTTKAGVDEADFAAGADSGADIATDASNLLATTYAAPAHSLTVVLVSSAGIVEAVDRDFTAAQRLTSSYALIPAASGSAGASS